MRQLCRYHHCSWPSMMNVSMSVLLFMTMIVPYTSSLPTASISSLTTTVQQAAAAAQILNTLGTITSSLTGTAPSLGSISGPRSTSNAGGTTGATGIGTGPIATGQVSSQQITSGMTTAFQFLQLVEPVSTLLTGSSSTLTSGLTNVLSGGLGGLPTIGSGGLGAGGGPLSGTALGGSGGPLSGAGISNPLTGGLPSSAGGTPSLPNGPTSGTSDTSSVKYYTIAFAVDPNDAPSISSVDLHYRVQYVGQAGVNTIQTASMSRTSTTTFTYSKVAIDSSQGSASIIYTFTYTITGQGSQTTATFQYTPGDSAPTTIVPDGYTSTGLGLVTDAATPYLHGIMVQSDGSYSLLWQSKYPTSFGANWVNAHYVINSGTQVDTMMQPMETTQEFAISRLPVVLGNTVAYSFTYEDAATSVATNSDWVTVTLRAAGSNPVNQSNVAATASTRVLPGNLFTGSGPSVGTPPKLGTFGGSTSSDPPTVYVSGSCPARVEYTQSVVTDGNAYAIQFTVKTSDLAVTLVDVKYSVGSATTPVLAHLTASSSTLWVLRSVSIADTQTMTYYFTFCTSTWSCSTAVFTFAPAQADTTTSGLPTPGGGTGIGGGNGFPTSVPNDAPFPSIGSGSLPSPSDLLSSQDLAGCVSVSCYESCLTSSLISTGMTACINNCVQDCALASQGQTAIVNSMRLIRLMRSMRMLSGQSTTSIPAPSGLSGGPFSSRRLLQSDEPFDGSINGTLAAAASSSSASSEPIDVSTPVESEYGGTEYGGNTDSSSSSTGSVYGGETSSPNATVQFNCTSKETWNNISCAGTWWSPDADPNGDAGGVKMAQLLGLLSDTTSVDGVPSLACTKCFESAVDAEVSHSVAMNGCATKCVGIQLVTEGDTPLETFSSLLTVMDPTMLTALFTNAADNGILGMYELMTQLLMRSVGAMYWSGGSMPERTGGVFNISGGPSGAGGLAGIIARNLSLSLPDGPAAPSSPSTPSPSLPNATSPNVPSLPSGPNITGSILPGRRLLQDGSSLSEILAATQSIMSGTADDSTLTYDTTDTDTSSTTDTTDSCSDDAITACSTACLPADIGNANGASVNLFKQRVCTENCMWPCLQSQVPFNFDTMRVMRIMSVTQQLRTASPRQGGFNTDATMTTTATDTSSDTPVSMLTSLLGNSASNAADIFATLSSITAPTAPTAPSAPTAPGSGTGLPTPGGTGAGTLGTLPGRRNLTSVISPFGTVLAAMLPDASNFTMGPTSYDDDLTTILNRACQSCFIACLSNMTAMARQACADTCTSECMDMSRPGSTRPFPTLPAATATATTTATSQRKAAAAVDGLMTMASVMSLSTPSFATAILDSGTRGLMDSVFSYTQSGTATSLGTSRPTLVDTIVNSGSSATTIMNLVSGLSDTLGTGLSSLVSTSNVGKVATLFSPSAATSLDLFGAMAAGRAPRTAAMTSTYDSFHQFLLRGLSDTMLFPGVLPGDNATLFGVDGALQPPADMPSPGVNGYPTRACTACYYQCMNDYKHSLIGMCTRQQCQTCYTSDTTTVTPSSGSSSSVPTRRLLTIVPPVTPPPIRPSIRLTPEQNVSPSTSATTATGSSRPTLLPPVVPETTIAALLASNSNAATPPSAATIPSPAVPAGGIAAGSINSLDDAAAAFIAMTKEAADQVNSNNNVADRGINTHRTPVSRRYRNAAAAAAANGVGGVTALPSVGVRPSFGTSSERGSVAATPIAAAASSSASVASSGSSLRNGMPSLTTMSSSCALCHKQCFGRNPGNVARCNKTCVSLC